MRWTLGLAVVLAACGRAYFDPLHDARGPDGQGTDGADGSAPALACDASNPDLVACFEFESDGKDGSSYHNDITVLAGASFPPGHAGRGLRVGSGSIVTTPYQPSLDPTTAFTIDAWVNLDQLPATGTRAVVVDNELSFLLGFTPTGLECSGVFHVDVTVAPPTSTWTHVGCTYDNTAMTVYLDGANLGPMPMTGAIAAGTMGLQIGANTPDATSPNPDNLIGIIDELRIWRVVMPCAVDGSC